MRAYQQGATPLVIGKADGSPKNRARLRRRKSGHKGRKTALTHLSVLNQDAAHAREEAAKLRGQLEATQVQATELLRVIGQKEASARPTPAKRTPSQKTENKAR